MKIISIIQQKGGVGKTTLCINLAATLQRMGASIHVFDADPQQSAVAWAAPNQLPFTVHDLPFTPDFPVAWAKRILVQTGDIGLIDTGAGLGAQLQSVVELSDLLILPCGPSSLELLSLRDTIERVGAVKQALSAGRPPLLLVPVRVDEGTEEGRYVVEELQTFGPRVAASVPYDLAFVRAFTTGGSVLSFASHSPADQAMSRVTEDVIRSIKWS